MVEKLQKGMKFIFLLIMYFAIEIVSIGYYTVKGIISAPIWGKLGIVGTYAGIVLMAVFKRALFIKAMGMAVIVVAGLAIWLTFDAGAFWEEEIEDNRKTVAPRMCNPFFEGMDVEQAKCEYRRLLKMYHPDNKSGDMEKTKAVIMAYKQYCTEHGIG